MRVFPGLLALLALFATTAPALELELPGNASLSGEVQETLNSYQLPTGPFANGAIPTLKVEGRLLQQAWRLEAQGMMTLQLIKPLRTQLSDMGYEVIFDCTGQECGGFDFRFNTRIMAAPDMFVDLFDYRFLAAQRGGTGEEETEYVSVIASRSGATGYVQIIHVAPRGAPTLTVDNTGATTLVRPGSGQPLAQALVGQGHVILSDLVFESGSSSLGEGPFETLQDLAEYLNADTTRRVALVGHTDTVGGLEPNIALSHRRAASVLERLAASYGVARNQMEAGGMGYLSPIVSNLSSEGREANRRVEAVLLNTE